MAEMLYLLAEYFYYLAYQQWENGYSEWWMMWDMSRASFNPGQSAMTDFAVFPAGDDVILEWGGGEAEWFMYADPSWLAEAQLGAHEAAEQALGFTIDDGAEPWYERIEKADALYYKAMMLETAADLLEIVT